MSFYDELTQKPEKKKYEFADKLYVDCIINAIKNECLYNKNKGKKTVKGYLYKDLDTEYQETYSCSVVSNISTKKDIASHQRGRVGQSYYPYDPSSYWRGPVFNIGEGTIRRIKEAFNELGFKNAKMEFIKVDYEVCTSGVFHVVTYQKTGESGYLIQVDISW